MFTLNSNFKKPKTFPGSIQLNNDIYVVCHTACSNGVDKNPGGQD